MRLACFNAAWVLLIAAAAARAQPAEPATLMTTRGKLLISEDLATEPPDVTHTTGLTTKRTGWSLWSGRWEFKDGALHGTRLDTDTRGATAARVFHFTDAVIQFDLRLDGRQVHFRLQDIIPEHICRVIINRGSFTAQKDDHDHKGPDEPVPFGKAVLPWKPGEWKTVLFETRGQEMVVTIDGRSVTGSHPLLAAEKAFFDFSISAGSAGLRNLRVWEALPNPQWPANKAKITPAK